MFSRTLGETSDVVMKEMYTFEDRGGDSHHAAPGGHRRRLPRPGHQRPDPVAAAEGVLRRPDVPLRAAAEGPLPPVPPDRHRADRPGRTARRRRGDRLRLGHPEGARRRRRHRAGDSTRSATRRAAQAYRDALVAYFTAHQAALSEDSLARLERNPLRILDTKDEGDRRIVADAPTIAAYLTEAAATFYARLQDAPRPLRRAVPRKPAHRARPRLLRPHRLRIRHHQARRAGHRDGAAAAMTGWWRRWAARRRPPSAGPPVSSGSPCCWTTAPAAPAAVAVVPVGDAAEAAALEVLQSLRHAGIRAEMAYRGNLRRRMERANRIGARAAVILGDDDIARGVAQVKDLATGEQEAVALAGDRRPGCDEPGAKARPHRRARRRTARHADARACPARPM